MSDHKRVLAKLKSNQDSRDQSLHRIDTSLDELTRDIDAMRKRLQRLIKEIN